MCTSLISAPTFTHEQMQALPYCFFHKEFLFAKQLMRLGNKENSKEVPNGTLKDLFTKQEKERPQEICI